MKTRFTIPEHLKDKEEFEIECYKAVKAGDATSTLVPEISTAVAAAFREKGAKDLLPSMKLLQEQYAELRNPMTTAAMMNFSVMGLLGSLWNCRKQKAKDTEEKRELVSESKEFAASVGKLTVSE